MGKPSKKSATKVEAAPAAAAIKPAKKGKREAEEGIEKQVATKKQKLNASALKQAIDKKKTEAKTQKKNKKVESSSSKEDDSSEEEVKVKPAAKQPVKKPVVESSEDDSSSSDEEAVVAPSKNGTVGKPGAKGKVASSTSDESDSESDDDEEPKSKVPEKKVSAAAVAKNGPVAAKKKAKSSDESDSDDSSDDDETPKVASKAARKKVTDVSLKKGKDDTSGSESESDASDSDEKPKVAKAKKEDGSSEEDSSEEETSESDEEDKKVTKTPKKKDGDVEMVDADSAKKDTKKAPQTPGTPQVQATGSKTLFMGNLSFSIDTADVENFFKDAGEVADVRFASDRDGKFKGFGHVEFATVEAAQNALKLNGQQLLGREVRLDLARERGEYTPASGNENSYQKGGRSQAQGTIFVRGFDTSGGEEKVRSALEEHFGSCGDISRVSIPKDYEGGLKGIAYMDFTNTDGLNKALELNGSELGEGVLTVEEAKPRDNSFGSGGGGGGRGRGRSDGGGRFSGGRGGRFGGGGRSGGGRFGGDSGGRFGGGRSDGGRGRGRGGSNRPSMATRGTGRKTTFDA